MSLSPGTRLGAYEIKSVAGAGGMGEVYRAVDTRLDRIVAIKVMPGHIAAAPESRQRFEREARTVASLNHPNICTLYDLGHEDSSPEMEHGVDYLVMEFLDGVTLEQRLRTGALPVAQALHIGIQIAEALTAAHRAGVVHRDLKPGNVMLTRAGARLLDFGLARTVSSATGADATAADRTSLTTQGTLLGTLHYMAPEQLDGREVDTRADVFAFGAVLYEMVTGLKAF